VNLIVSRRENVLLVPTRALKGNAVWVLQDGRVQQRQVKKGVAGSERTEIVSGLTEGERVVVSPADTLRDGQRARGVPAAASDASAPSDASSNASGPSNASAAAVASAPSDRSTPSAAASARK